MAMGLSGSSSRRGRRGSKRAPMAEINVTPFVDVMLVLLIIFMVTAPLLTSGVPVDLPDTRANPLPQEQDPITIAVGPSGIIYLDDEPLANGELPARLAAIRPGPDGELPAVSLRGDRDNSYGRILAVMGELNRAGFKSIQMVGSSSAAPPQVIGGSDNEQ